MQRPQVDPGGEASPQHPEPWQPEPLEVERPQVHPEAALSQTGEASPTTPPPHPLEPAPTSMPPPLPVAVYPPGHPWAGYPVIPGDRFPDDQSRFPLARVPQGPRPVAERTFWSDALIDSAIIVALIIGFTFVTILGVAVALLASGNFNAQAFDLTSMPPPLLWLMNFLMFGTQVVIVGVAVWRLGRNKRAGRPDPKLFEGDWLWGLVWGIPAGLVAQLGAVLYTFIIQNVFGVQADSEQVQMIQAIARNGPALVVLIFMVTIMAPIGEELFFRGAVYGSARASGFASAGATISAVLFAAAHLNLALAPYYGAVALLLCWLFARTRTLVAPMAAHFALNVSAVIATVMTIQDNTV